MKFKFTTTPLKDVPLGTVVDGYKLTSRSHTGKNAIGWKRGENGRFEEVLLVYSPGPSIEGLTDVMENLLQQPAAPYLERKP